MGAADEEPAAEPDQTTEQHRAAEDEDAAGNGELTTPPTRDPDERGDADGDVAEARRQTTLQLRDCELNEPFYFFFEPESAGMSPEEVNRASQLAHCLTRAETRGRLHVLGRSELETDALSTPTLALSRAHNIAQRLVMDGAVIERVTVQAAPPQAYPEEQAAWGRRVEVRIGP